MLNNTIISLRERNNKNGTIIKKGFSYEEIYSNNVFN